MRVHGLRLLLAMGFAVGWGGLGMDARGGDFPVEEQVVVKSDLADSKQVNDPKYGQGKEEKKTWAFTVQLHNTGGEPIPAVSLKLYVVQIKNWLPQMDHDKAESVAKVLTRDAVPVDDTPVDLGEVEISNFTSDAGAEKWFGGFKYAGYILEVYRDGKLADVKMGGNAVVRKAYDSYLTGKGGPPPPP